MRSKPRRAGVLLRTGKAAGLGLLACCVTALVFTPFQDQPWEYVTSPVPWLFALGLWLIVGPALAYEAFRLRE